MVTKLQYGIIGVLILGLTGTGILIFTPDQLDAAYTCTTTNVTGIFERFSSTYKTAYWTENGLKKQVVCINGVFIRTREWLKQYNVTESQVTMSPLIESDIDELGNPIIKNQTINVYKSGKVNIDGKIYNIECPMCNRNTYICTTDKCSFRSIIS